MDNHEKGKAHLGHWQLCVCVCVCVCLLPGASLDTFSLETCVQCGGCAVDFVKHCFSSASTKSGIPDLCLIPFHWHRKCLHACKCTSRNSFCLQLPCQLHISVWVQIGVGSAAAAAAVWIFWTLRLKAADRSWEKFGGLWTGHSYKYGGSLGEQESKWLWFCIWVFEFSRQTCVWDCTVCNWRNEWYGKETTQSCHQEIHVFFSAQRFLAFCLGEWVYTLHLPH